jgi:maltokinase
LICLLNGSSIWERLDTVPRAGDGRTSELLSALAWRVPAPYGVTRFHPLPALPAGAVERGFDVDQTNHSVVVGETVVVKWLTPAAPLPQPAPEMLAHLAEVGFTATAAPYAAITRGGELLALVTAYLPDARDGWEWCVDEAAAGRTGFTAGLGVLAADLHVALATPSAAFPDPVRLSPACPPGGRERPPARSTESGRRSRSGDPGAGPGTRPPSPWAVRAEAALGEALELTGGEDGEWLAARADLLAERFRVLSDHGPTPLIRIHGDLHVGQILRWSGGYAVVDFDGNPTVSDADPYQPAARDLAQLSTSLEHAGQVAIRRRDADPAATARWAARAVLSLRDAYTGRLRERGHAHLLHDGLLRAFAAEQECRELVYAARHLPRWRYAPMGVLRSWYD